MIENPFEISPALLVSWLSDNSSTQKLCVVNKKSSNLYDEYFLLVTQKKSKILFTYKFQQLPPFHSETHLNIYWIHDFTIPSISLSSSFLRIKIIR